MIILTCFHSWKYKSPGPYLTVLAINMGIETIFYLSLRFILCSTQRTTRRMSQLSHVNINKVYYMFRLTSAVSPINAFSFLVLSLLKSLIACNSPSVAYHYVKNIFFYTYSSFMFSFFFRTFLIQLNFITFHCFFVFLYSILKKVLFGFSFHVSAWPRCLKMCKIQFLEKRCGRHYAWIGGWRLQAF